MFLRHQHRGSSGQLSSRMKDFGLPHEALLSRYQLLVELDWLRPAFHVPIEREWFENWANFPLYPATLRPNESSWEWNFDIRWFITEKDFSGAEWFLHPYVQSTGAGAEFILRSVKSPTSIDVTAFVHSRGFKVVPAYDYFFEWQLFRLADLVSHARGDSWHPWLPGSYDDFVEYSKSVTPETFNRPANLTRWDKRGEAFGWLAHYIAFEKAFDQYEFSETRSANFQANANKDRALEDLYAKRREGASALVAWLQIDSTRLETALKEEFLTLAQNWRWKKWDKTDHYVQLWRALQAQIQSAVDWLCLLTEKSRVDYLNQFRYTHFGQDVRAQLEDVLPYSQWKSAVTLSRYVTEIGKRYPAAKFCSLGEFAIDSHELVAIGGRVDAFDDYIESIGRFIEESTVYANKDDPFRARSRESWYRLIAVLSEILFEVIEKSKSDSEVTKKKIPGVKNPAPLCVVAERLARKGTEFNRIKKQEQGNSHEKYLEDLAEGIRKAGNKDTLILYFTLAIHAARNGKAHAYGRNHAFLSAAWAAPVFDALVYFVPWAVTELLKKAPTAPAS